MFDTRQVAGTQRRDEADPLPRQEHAEHGARPGEHDALDQHLPDDAAAAAADRRPHRDLAPTLGRPDQQQVRDVGARDQQHEPDGTKEGEQGGPRVAHDITVQPGHPDLQVLSLVERVDFAQARGDCVHLLLRLFQCDAVTQPRDDRQPGPVPREVGDVGGQHAPGIDVRRHRRVRRQIDPERRRQDTHHDRAPAIQLDRAADHIRIAAESPLPQPVAQHHLARRQVGIGVRELLRIDRDRVILSKGPTVEWSDAEHLEQVPRRVAVRDALGLAGAGQRAGDGHRPGEALEPRGLGLVVPKIGSRYERALDIGRLQARPHERQLLGMIVRQRTKQNGVRHAEHRHVAADAERKGEDDHRREQRPSDEGANRVLEVANDVADHDYGCASCTPACGRRCSISAPWDLAPRTPDETRGRRPRSSPIHPIYTPAIVGRARTRGANRWSCSRETAPASRLSTALPGPQAAPSRSGPAQCIPKTPVVSHPA